MTDGMDRLIRYLELRKQAAKAWEALGNRPTVALVGDQASDDILGMAKEQLAHQLSSARECAETSGELRSALMGVFQYAPDDSDVAELFNVHERTMKEAIRAAEELAVQQ